MKSLKFVLLFIFLNGYADLNDALLLLENQLTNFLAAFPLEKPSPKSVTTYEILFQKILDNKYSIIQLEVVDQFGPQGGGAASCGYHGLKNAWYINQGLSLFTQN